MLHLFQVQLSWDGDNAGDILVILLLRFIINTWPHYAAHSPLSHNVRSGRLSHLDLCISTHSFYSFSRTGIEDGARRAPERFLMIQVGWAWNQDPTPAGHVKPTSTRPQPARFTVQGEEQKSKSLFIGWHTRCQTFYILDGIKTKKGTNEKIPWSPHRITFIRLLEAVWLRPFKSNESECKD